jgi:nucleotide-binding universal stress UspA family protein
METYKTILFASNLSENSRMAFTHAARIARIFGSKIVLLHVIDEMPRQLQYRISNIFGENRWNEMLKEHTKNARRSLTGKISSKQLIRVALSGFAEEQGISGTGDGTAQHEVVIKDGDVAGTILEQSELNRCDLIVLGASKGLLSGTAVGNTIKSVLKGAQVPVMVVPPVRPD